MVQMPNQKKMHVVNTPLSPVIVSILDTPPERSTVNDLNVLIYAR